jgi:hypothetical protein
MLSYYDTASVGRMAAPATTGGDEFSFLGSVQGRGVSASELRWGCEGIVQEAQPLYDIAMYVARVEAGLSTPAVVHPALRSVVGAHMRRGLGFSCGTDAGGKGSPTGTPTRGYALAYRASDEGARSSEAQQDGSVDGGEAQTRRVLFRSQVLEGCIVWYWTSELGYGVRIGTRSIITYIINGDDRV